MLALIVAIILTVGVALLAQMREPDQWRWDDWAAVTGGVLLGFFFLVLAHLLQRRQAALQEQLHWITRGLSNSLLQEKIGQISVQSLRSFTSSVDECLRVAPEALAAMQLFEMADDAEQAKFVSTLFDAYSSMTLNAFVRTRSLPLAASRRLQRDGRELRRELERVDKFVQRPLIRQQIAYLNDHIEVCLDLEETWRSGGSLSSGLPQGCVRALYRPELQVYHNWELEGAKDMQGSRETHELATSLENYYSPWYVMREGAGYREVNFKGRPENSEIFQSGHDLPVWPHPIKHADIVGSGLRARGIVEMSRNLEMVRPRAMALLVYELPDKRRIVLDGNHRLAGALHLEAAGRWAAPDDPSPLIAVFVLREMTGRRPMGKSTKRTRLGNEDEWYGFNPDVENLRQAALRTT